MTAGLTSILRPAAASASATIVLLHGIQGTAAAWNGVIGKLPADFAVIAPNFRGRAGSPSLPEAEGHTIDGFCEDLAGVLALLRGPVWLCGWSMGVLVALAYAQRHGTARLAGLVLASGTARPMPGAIWFKGETMEAIAKEAEDRAKSLGLTLTASPAAVAGAWFSVRSADLTAMLPRIDVPALILHGEEDRQCPPEHGRMLAGHIPGARYDLWAGAGHNLMDENPARFAEAIADFVRLKASHDLHMNSGR